jgi:hypothetical protein
VTEEENTKKCSKCKEVKPKGVFGKCKSAKDGLAYHCKACRKLYTKELAVKNRVIYEENKDSLPETKICCACKEDKPRSEFSNNATQKDGLQADCKECKKVYGVNGTVKNKLRYANGEVVPPERKICGRCKSEKPSY